MKYTMWRTQNVLALVALYVGLAQSWDIAVSKGHVLEFYANGTLTESLRFDCQNLTALVYDEKNDKLLYVDKLTGGGDRICSYGISSTENLWHTEVNGRNIHSLAFDPATELLFFSDTNDRSINWISLKHGSNNNIYGHLLIKTGDGIPTDVAVDSCRGYVYWINKKLDGPTIERAAFNGSGREDVLTISGYAPHSLVIDQLTQKIYFIVPLNRTLQKIRYTDLNGKNDQFFMSLLGNNTEILRPSSTSLTVTKTFLLWVDYCSDCAQVVWKFPKTSSDPAETYTHFSLGTNGVIGGIVANYKIKDYYQYNQDCEPLTPK